MTSRDLMCAAMRRQPSERIPTMPQTLRDVAVHIYEQEDGLDWIDATKRCLENPALSEEYVIRLSRDTGCDGMRLHVRPDPVKVQRSGDDLFVLDPKTGNSIGRVDLHGGGGVILNNPQPPVETLDEVRVQLAQQVASFSDEKIEYLRQTRQRVPDLFVATPPGGITMNTYTLLRGRAQAMTDFFDRPDFVHAVMTMQAEAVIEKGEKLIKAGVDAFYIGDPAASASLISPRHFEEFCLPAYQMFCRHFKGRGVLIYIHICGNSVPLFEMMAETGADVIEPLDPLGGVSVADAKRRVGDKVALMGGVNTLTLASGTAAEVRAEAIQKCREGGPYGYILAAGDMVPPLTPRANLQALVDVARYSQYVS